MHLVFVVYVNLKNDYFKGDRSFCQAIKEDATTGIIRILNSKYQVKGFCML